MSLGSVQLAKATKSKLNVYALHPENLADVLLQIHLIFNMLTYVL